MINDNLKSGLKIRTCPVGLWGTNAYAVVCPRTRKSILVDPGADPEALTELLAQSSPTAIVLTHTHSDHTGALSEMLKRLKVPLMTHPDARIAGLNLKSAQQLPHGCIVDVGRGRLKIFHTPGHTADQISLMIEGGRHAIVGDTIFEGGPGKTWSAREFKITLNTLQKVILSWPDETVCHPGHGPSFRLGDRRSAIEAFLKKDHGSFFGDATWGM